MLNVELRMIPSLRFLATSVVKFDYLNTFT